MVHLLAVVIIQTPVYNPFYIVIRDNNLKIIENPLIRVNNHYEIDFELLAKQIDNEFREYLRGEHFSCGNLFGLTALKTAYNEAEEWLELQNKHLANNYKIIKEFFNTNYPQVGVTEQGATYLAWLDFSFLNMPCAQMQEELLKLGVMVNDGKRYSENCNGFIRFNFACPEGQLREGLKIIGTFIDNHTK